MTGKELILYILENNLEDQPVFQNGRFLDFLTVEEAAVKFGVGIATVYVWVESGLLTHIEIGNNIYISDKAEKPNSGISISKSCVHIF